MPVFRMPLMWAVSVGVALSTGAATSVAYHVAADRPATPARSQVAPVVLPVSAFDPGIEQAALSAVRAGGGVDLADGGTCPADRLTVSWSDPGAGWHSGAVLTPVGPAPGSGTHEVNGLVLCRGSHYAYVGFDALSTADGWSIELVPDPAGGVDDETTQTNTPDTAPLPTPAPKPSLPLLGQANGVAIEGYAPYEPQRVCDPSAKPGTLALRNLLLSHYPGTTSLGISRACGVGGRSEHKEGRAFDWGARVGVPAQRKAAQDFLTRLLASDSHGNQHALVRRMGVMYVIWNHRIWSAARADQGWREYSGSSPHTDHVHLSLSWAGARAQTSFWSGTVVEGLPSAPAGGLHVQDAAWHHRSTGTRPTTPTRTPSGTHTRDGRPRPSYDPAQWQLWAATHDGHRHRWPTPQVSASAEPTASPEPLPTAAPEPSPTPTASPAPRATWTPPTGGTWTWTGTHHHHGH